ncbi:hypothetical protein [Desulfoscipio sp. XC116]|uniref:hypothetical protein n=1 Tax=Desulfoscipio sp. XC116 TaxID=3144975 RepID=UPI00325C1629
MGSVSIIVDEEIALVGDAMVHGISGNIYPLFVDNPKLLLNSWQKLLNTKCRLFLPAHGGENTRIVVSRYFDRYAKK